MFTQDSIGLMFSITIKFKNLKIHTHIKVNVHSKFSLNT